MDQPSHTPPQPLAWPLLGMSDDFPLIMPPAGAIATWNGPTGAPRAVRAVRVPHIAYVRSLARFR